MQFLFSNPAVIWFALGFLFLILEFIVPGLILFFFAVGAWIVAAVCLFSPADPSINVQLVLFLASSIVAILIFRKGLKRLIRPGRQATQFLEDEFRGKTGRAATAIAPGRNGKVDFKGTRWDASSEDHIEEGEPVTVVGNDSILLIVRSTKT